MVLAAGESERAPSADTRGGFSLRWSALYSAGNLGAGLTFAFANNALPLYLASYGLPNWAIGLLAQDRPPLAGVSQLFVGALSDRTRSRLGRRRPFIVAGVPVTALALLLLAPRPPTEIMIALLVVMTTALAVAYGPYLAMLADLVPVEQRSRVGGVQNLANFFGQIGMLVLLTQLWQAQQPLVFAVVAGGLLIGFGITVVGVREASTTATPRAPITFQPLRYVRELLSHRQVLLYLTATLFFWLGTGGVVPFLTRFGVSELGTDEGTAFQILLVPLFASALFTLPAGWLGDRLGKKRVLMAGLILLGVSVMIGSQVQSVGQALPVLAVTGAANAMCSVVLFPLLADLIPRRRAGEFTGIGSAVWELAQPMGAVLAGATADVTGTLRTSLLVAGALTLVGAVVLLPLRVNAAQNDNLTELT